MIRRMERVVTACQQALAQMCSEAEGLTGRSLGGRIWLLPGWYVIANHRETALVLRYTELMLRLLQRPRMTQAAAVFGPIPASSGIPWAVRKGLPGQLTFGTELFEVLQHSEFWPENLETMSDRQWRALDDTKTLGRTLGEARTLKRLYGTVVGVPMVDPQSKASLGCVTLHTKAHDPLSDEHAIELAIVMTAATSELATQVVNLSGLAARL